MDVIGVGLVVAEACAGGIDDPGVVAGARHASVQSDGLSGQLPGAEGTGVGNVAGGLALDVALLLPGGEVPQPVDVCRVSYPLQHLLVGHEVDIVPGVESLLDPGCQRLREPLVALEPGGVEGEAEGSTG